MKVYQPNELKNITLIGSAGSGKTTLAESIMFESGVINRRGEVESKNTVSDYFPIEHEQERYHDCVKNILPNFKQEEEVELRYFRWTFTNMFGTKIVVIVTNL
mgnify:CR=1 FL=1